MHQAWCLQATDKVLWPNVDLAKAQMWTHASLLAQADVFNPPQWRHKLKGAIGVMSCLGGFGSNEFMYKVPTQH